MPPAPSQPPATRPPPPACGAPLSSPPPVPSAQSPVPPPSADSIVDAATNPYLSLRDIADSHNITLETLTLFLDRPDIRERLAQIDSVTSRRTQSIAAACLPAVVKSLNRIVEAYLWEESKIVVTPTNFSQLEQRRRAAETTRRAGALLYRLSRPPTPPRSPRPAAPRTPTAQENPGIPSLGPAPSDSEPAIPTPRAPSAPVAPTPPHSPSASPELSASAPLPVPSAQSPVPSPSTPSSLRGSVASSLVAPHPDAALLRQLAQGRRAAARILHQLAGPAP
jgi:hypothetical protein